MDWFSQTQHQELLFVCQRVFKNKSILCLRFVVNDQSANAKVLLQSKNSKKARWYKVEFLKYVDQWIIFSIEDGHWEKHVHLYQKNKEKSCRT